MEKLKYKTIQWEYEQEAIKERKGNPRHRGLGSVTRNRGTYGRGGSSRSAVTETRRQTCKECGEEFCLGTCKKYLYDDHSRTLNPLSDDIFQVNHQKITKKGSKKATANAKSSKVDDKATSEGGVDIEADQVETAAATVEPTNNSNVGETSSGVGQLETANERRSSIKSTSRESKGAKPKVHRAKKVTKRKKETDGGK